MHIPKGCATHYRQKRTLRQIVAYSDKESLSKAGTPIRQYWRILPIHRTKSRTGTSLHYRITDSKSIPKVSYLTIYYIWTTLKNSLQPFVISSKFCIFAYTISKSLNYTFWVNFWGWKIGYPVDFAYITYWKRAKKVEDTSPSSSTPTNLNR